MHRHHFMLSVVQAQASTQLSVLSSVLFLHTKALEHILSLQLEGYDSPLEARTRTDLMQGLTDQMENLPHPGRNLRKGRF